MEGTLTKEEVEENLNKLYEELNTTAWSKTLNDIKSKMTPETVDLEGNPFSYTISYLAFVNIAKMFFDAGALNHEEYNKTNEILTEIDHLENELERLKLLDHYRDIGDMPDNGNEEM